MKVVRKFFLDFEKEEKFLNDMSTKGYAMKKYTFGKYVFEETEKNEYKYRIEFLNNEVSHKDSKQYIAFLSEMGIECVASYWNWVYLRKKDGDFDMYSDLDSRIKHYKKIRMYNLTIIILNLVIGLLNQTAGQYLVRRGFPPINIYVSILPFTVVLLLLGFVFIPIELKINQLSKEKQIHE